MITEARPTKTGWFDWKHPIFIVYMLQLLGCHRLTQLVLKNEDITKLKTNYNTLWEKYKILILQWNDLTKQPEIIEAVKRGKNARNKKRRQKVRNRQDKTDTKLYLTDSLVKVRNNSKPFRNQAE